MREHDIIEASTVHPDLVQALEHALSAGACRRAAVLNPASRLQWMALAEAERLKALERLRLWAVTMATPVGRSRA